MENGQTVATMKPAALSGGQRRSFSLSKKQLKNGHESHSNGSTVVAKEVTFSKQQSLTPTEEVTFCHFDQLFDLSLNGVLLNIFLRVDAADLEA